MTVACGNLPLFEEAIVGLLLQLRLCLRVYGLDISHCSTTAQLQNALHTPPPIQPLKNIVCTQHSVLAISY